MTAGIRVYPASLVLEGRSCLVVGGGPIAARKVEGLLAAGAEVTVVAPSIVDEIRSLPVRLEPRPYRRGEAGGYRLAVTATGVPAVDRTVFEDGERSGVFVNAADDPDACSFLVPAIVRSGPVTIAVSTGGVSPALAAWLKSRIAEVVGPEVETLAAMVGGARAVLRRRGVSTEGLDWASLIAAAAGLLSGGAEDEAAALLDAWIDTILARPAAGQGGSNGTGTDDEALILTSMEVAHRN